MRERDGIGSPGQGPGLSGGGVSTRAAPTFAGRASDRLAGRDGPTKKSVKGGPRRMPVGARTGPKRLWIGVVVLLALIVVAGDVWRSHQRVGGVADTMISARSPSSPTGDDMAGTQATIGQGQSGATAAAAAKASAPVTSQAGVNRAAGGPNAGMGAQAGKRYATADAAPSDDDAQRAGQNSTPHARLPAQRAAREPARGNAAHAARDDSDAAVLATLFKYTNATGAPDATATAGGSRVPERIGASAHGANTTPGSLAAQVAACRSKGLLSGEVCRWQACKGHWGSDPACPAAQPAESVSTH